jgi:hypothetical protein
MVAALRIWHVELLAGIECILPPALCKDSNASHEEVQYHM